MKELGVLFIIIWLIFAFFDVSFKRDIFIAYTANERSDYREGDKLPRLLPNAVNEYKISNDKVVGRVGAFINEYERCTIFDVDNWTCTYSDDSATFGAKQGVYFEYNNTDKFPHLEDYGQSETLSRFGYILLQCRWDTREGLFAIMCLFRPFTV